MSSSEPRARWMRRTACFVTANEARPRCAVASRQPATRTRERAKAIETLGSNGAPGRCSLRRAAGPVARRSEAQATAASATSSAAPASRRRSSRTHWTTLEPEADRARSVVLRRGPGRQDRSLPARKGLLRGDRRERRCRRSRGRARMNRLSPDIYLLAEHFPKPVNSIQLPMTERKRPDGCRHERARHLLS